LQYFVFIYIHIGAEQKSNSSGDLKSQETWFWFPLSTLTAADRTLMLPNSAQKRAFGPEKLGFFHQSARLATNRNIPAVYTYIGGAGA